MKRPSQDQLQQLMSFRQYSKAMEYLQAAEDEYMTRIVEEPDSDRVRQIQGSLHVLRELKKLINHER